MTVRRVGTTAALVALLSWHVLSAGGGRASIDATDLKAWLTYIASDELQGRATFTDGLGLAAGYLQSHLQQWGVKPAGDDGTFLQTVRVQGVKVVNRSSVTIRVGNETRTFKDGDGVTFPRQVGQNRRVTITRVEFAGYGLEAPDLNHRDFNGRTLSNTAVVYLGTDGPRKAGSSYRRILTGRSRYATDQLNAAAVIGPPEPGSFSRTGRRSVASPDGDSNTPDFTTSQRLDLPVTPAVSGSDALFEFLFSRAPVKYSDLRRKASAQDDLPHFTLDDVSVTFDIDADYTIVRTQLTENVVGIVEGSDPQLKQTYVAFGAHYDHVGYAESELTKDGRRPAPPGTVRAADDRIWNGADDDGSGTVALMAIARAFEEGPRPKRSLLFVWHAGEEIGLYGSRYFADHPTVPIGSIVAQLNVDMIGRNRNDDPAQENTVYLVGSDRISSELHQVSREANQALPRPLALDYELNDPGDPEQFYYRSDHYSYAAKGIPIIFFTTGLHPDYHANTDDVSKIEFSKLTRIAQFVYETGVRLGNMDHAPVRDNKGPRAGKGTTQ
ncbi:MAG: M20/M25/M40 family metallo-hydrolase [Acidobacteriaceae bacterium]|jgi:hypothetical protein|nr:M20/M25/M40 family metallo-hydrolase [Acidobacteriaceae bacterium]